MARGRARQCTHAHLLRRREEFNYGCLLFIPVYLGAPHIGVILFFDAKGALLLSLLVGAASLATTQLRTTPLSLFHLPLAHGVSPRLSTD